MLSYHEDDSVVICALLLYVLLPAAAAYPMSYLHEALLFCSACCTSTCYLYMSSTFCTFLPPAAFTCTLIYNTISFFFSLFSFLPLHLLLLLPFLYVRQKPARHGAGARGWAKMGTREQNWCLDSESSSEKKMK